MDALDTIVEVPSQTRTIATPSGVVVAELALIATRPGWLSFEAYKLFVLRAEAMRAAR